MKKIFKDKKIFIIVGVIILLIIASLATKCSISKKRVTSRPNIVPKENLYDFDENYKGRKVGVIYFSVTGNTKNVAEKIAKVFEVEPVAIEPEIPYTSEDLNYTDKNSRVSLENDFYAFDLKDSDGNTISETTEGEEDGKIHSLPNIKKVDVKKYSVIFLGYPIWFGEAPKVMYKFIDNKDLVGKTIVPFCTSGSSDIGMSDQNLANFAPVGVNFMGGERFDKNVSDEKVKDWVTKISADFDIFD